jgi:hypothetical protein
MSIQYYGQGAIADKVDELNLLMEFPQVRDLAMRATNEYNPDLNIDEMIRITGTQEQKERKISELKLLLNNNFPLSDFDWNLQILKDGDDEFRISLSPKQNIGIVEGTDIIKDEDTQYVVSGFDEQRNDGEPQIKNIENQDIDGVGLENDNDFEYESIEVEEEIGRENSNLASLMKGVVPTGMKKTLNVEMIYQIIDIDDRISSGEQMALAYEFSPDEFVMRLRDNNKLIKELEKSVSSQKELSDEDIHKLRGMASAFLTDYEHYLTFREKEGFYQSIENKMLEIGVDLNYLDDKNLSNIVHMDKEIIKHSDLEIKKILEKVGEFQEAYLLATRANNPNTFMPVSGSQKIYYNKRLEMLTSDIRQSSFASSLVLDDKKSADVQKTISHA